MSEQLARLLGTMFSPRGLRVAVPASLVALLLAGVGFAVFEDKSFADGLWWAFVTVTTVGYGDHVPETVGGKLVAVAVMVGGVGFLLVLAGAIVEHFVVVEREEEEVLVRLEALSARVEELAARLPAPVEPVQGPGGHHTAGRAEEVPLP